MDKIMKKYILFASSLLLAFVLSGCIQETFPTDYVLDSQIAQSESATEGMMNAVYSTLSGADPLNDGPMPYGGLKVMLDHGTSSLISPGYNGFNTMLQYSYGNFSYTNRARWPSALYYVYIKSVNDIISLYPEGTELTDVQKGYLGQCYAFRALHYMELTEIMEWKEPTDPIISKKITMPEDPNHLKNLGVPIVTETTSSEVASNNPRVTIDENFDLIFSDLAKAEELLADFTRTDKVQPDLSVVYGIYARAYLYLASRARTLAAKYTDEAALWQSCYSYAQKAIEASKCTPLTEAQWLDPVNGFNNRTSQNSWMLAYSVSASNTDAVETSWSPANIMGTETNYIVYGWRVGRGLARHWYDRLSDKDWRKKSWLDPSFFYESKNQKPGEPYLIETDAAGNLINNKWSLTGDNTSNEQSAWSDDYDGRLSDGWKYTLNSSASWVRKQASVANGFLAFPYLYLNLKFRPHAGGWSDVYTGGIIDWPMMRVEEMYFIKAEAALHTQGAGAAKSELESFMRSYRYPEYTCNASSADDVLEELIFEKDIEFWGEGVNYFDDKRLERGLFRSYLGCNLTRNQQIINCSGIFPGWTPMFSQTEMNANTAILHYNTPINAVANYHDELTLDEIKAHYLDPIDITKLKF